MSTRIKFVIVDSPHAFTHKMHEEGLDFLPKAIFEVTSIEFDHKEYQVIGMTPGNWKNDEIENTIIYFIKEIV
jgi:hypothetical protein